MNRIVRFWPLRCLNVSASKAAIYMLKSRRPKTFYSAKKKCTFWWQVTSNTTPGCEQAHIAIDRILWLDCFGNCTTKWGAKWLPSLLFICAAQDLGNGKARKMAPSSVDRRVSFCLKPCWFILKKYKSLWASLAGKIYNKIQNRYEAPKMGDSLNTKNIYIDHT